MLLYEIYCTNCDFIEEVLLSSSNEKIQKCKKCNGERKILCKCSGFKLKYDPKKDKVAWSNEGYASSQYWKDVKEAKERGEKVKGSNEN